MEASSAINEMIKMKKADSLSTLKDTDKRGKEESTLKENVEPLISTKSENTSPAAAPEMAKEFPHQFADRSFPPRIKLPVAPISHKKSMVKKTYEDVKRSNIFIERLYFYGDSQTPRGLEVVGEASI
jgi:hypothetical protein